MVEVLRNWKDQIETAGNLRPDQHRAIIRWFMDEDVNVGDLGRMILGIDEMISQATRGQPDPLNETADDPPEWTGFPSLDR